MDMGHHWRHLRAHGGLQGLDESDEVNACTVKCKVDVDGEEQDWLFLFKERTHNHPTEIEPLRRRGNVCGAALSATLFRAAAMYIRQCA